jgi:hypothetical protein
MLQHIPDKIIHLLLLSNKVNVACVITLATFLPILFVPTLSIPQILLLMQVSL